MGTDTVERGTYTVTEAARRLGISRSHAYELIAEGSLPAVALGARRVIPRQAIERLLAGE